MTLIEDKAYYQTWTDVPYNATDPFDISKGQILVFPFASVLSFLLLSVYIFSSMTNPVIMSQIAEEIEVKE